MSNVVVDAIGQYGFPIIAAMGLGYFVYYIWRMLDNDMIRLNMKLQMIIEQQKKKDKKDN